MHNPNISVVVPVLNEASTLPGQIRHLRAVLPAAELIVVDGGSDDDSASAAAAADLVLTAAPGRAVQMNAGAAAAQGDWLLFVHADTRLPEHIAEVLCSARAYRWGFFALRLDDPHPLLRLVGAMASLRSRLTGIATGDQCQFVERSLFENVGGFAPIPLMEDIELSTRLRKRHTPLVVRAPAISSARRWRQHGILRTIALMWWLRLRYFCGAAPDALHRRYYR